MENQWGQSLGFQRPKLHGGQFKGGECSKLLKNIHVLEELTKSSKLERDEHISSIVNSFKYLKSVKAACLGSGLLPEYELTINECKEAYVKHGLRVSPKVHALIKHTWKFLSLMSSSNPNKGLGFWTEQASESVHYDFKQFWESGLKVSSSLKDYPQILFKAMVTYNFRHTFIKTVLL